jgi:hypothetical protein
VDGEDDLLVGGGLLDVVRQLQRLLKLGPRPDPREDLLGEDPLADRFERGELGGEFLLRGRAAGVSSAVSVCLVRVKFLPSYEC